MDTSRPGDHPPDPEPSSSSGNEDCTELPPDTAVQLNPNSETESIPTTDVQQMQDENTVVQSIRNFGPQELANPALEEMFTKMAISAIPEGASPGTVNVVNIVREVNIIEGDAVINDNNIPDIIKRRMKSAKETFVRTDGYENANDALEHCGHVLICGSPGSGKTTTSLVIMNEYRKKKYDVLFVDNLSDFKVNQLKLSSPTLLVFDDIFGFYGIHHTEWVKCKKIFDNLDTYFRPIEDNESRRQNKGGSKDGDGSPRTGTSALKVIMNSRTNVWNMVKSKLLKYKHSLFRPSTVTDLTTGTKLKDHEKNKIVSKHLKRARIRLSENEIRLIAELEYSTLGFPYICQLFVDNYRFIKFKVQFFKEPLVYLEDLIENIFTPPESDSRAAVLLLMILNGGVLNLIDLLDDTRRTDTGLAEKLQKVGQIVKGPTPPHEINIAARNEIQTLILLENEVVSFSHPTIYDAAAYVVGKTNPIFVLENCSLQFILGRTHVPDSISDGEIDTFMIVLGQESSRCLLKRLAREVVHGNIECAMSHQCLASEENLHTLFEEISKTGGMDEVLHFRDEKFELCFLFWTSFTCVGPVWKELFQYTTFIPNELFEGCLGCCMSGNVSLLRTLTSKFQCTDVVIATSVGDILEQKIETRSLYRSLSTAGSPGKPDVPQQKETPRMHGNNRDLLIHIATANGFLPIVQLFLELGADINARGGNQMTALMYASYRGHVDLVKLLLVNGADPFLLDEEGDNSLHLACRGGSIEAIKLLHEKNMDLNIYGEHDRTPLMYASYNGHEQVVNFLLEKGANPTIASRQNKDNSLHLACVKGHTNIVRTFLDRGHIAIESPGQRDRTPLMYACRHGHLETAKDLESRKANINVRDISDYTCLHVAALSGHFPTVKWLLSKHLDFDIDCLTHTGVTPLMFAMQSGETDMVQSLIQKGASIHLKDSDDSSCLHFASRSGAESLVQLCLNGGLEINSVNKKEWTAAMFACRQGNITFLEYLVKTGADINQGTCLHAACIDGRVEMVEYLISQFKELDINMLNSLNRTPIMTACYHGHAGVVHCLHSHGADVKCKDRFGQTCIHIACRRGYLDMVDMLLELDIIDIDTPDTNGLTPLLYAIKNDFPDIIELLVRNGADIARRDKYQATCLHSSAWYGKSKACARILQLLEYHTGLDVNARDRFYRTPLAHAAKQGHREIVDLLLDAGADLHVVDKDGRNCYEQAKHCGYDDLANYIRRLSIG